ncbi:hypothetical protein ACOMHN_028850 [Nucella lapillus]
MRASQQTAGGIKEQLSLTISVGGVFSSTSATAAGAQTALSVECPTCNLEQKLKLKLWQQTAGGIKEQLSFTTSVRAVFSFTSAVSAVPLSLSA